MQIQTERLLLRRWRDTDRAPFAELNADPEVMRYFPALLTENESNEMVERIESAFEQRGFGLFALERLDSGEFIGFTGLSVPRFEAAFTPCVEIGWRLAKAHWHQGFATEAAQAVLEFGHNQLGMVEIVSFTAVLNQPSQRVMQRIGMSHDSLDDFDHPNLPNAHPLQRHVLYRSKQF